MSIAVSPQNANNRELTDLIVPLSRAQHLIWLSQSVAAHNPLYNLAVTYTIRGPLDVARFADACEELVGRSDILQSIIVDVDSDKPALRRQTSLRANCLLEQTPDEQSAARWVASRSQLPLDPRQRMFECALLSIADDHHVFYWCQHHLSSDGSNIPLVLEYIAQYYQSIGETRGHASGEQSAATSGDDTLAPPAYFEFLRRQQAQDGTARRQKITDYWQRKSASDHDVPDYFGRAFDHSHAKVRRVIELDEQQRQSIESILVQPGFRHLNRELSLFVLMATIMIVTGYRIHRNPAMNLGFPAHVRQNRSMQKLLGMVTGLGFLKLQLQTEDSFRSLAKGIKRELLEAFSHMEPGVQTRQTQQSFSCSLNILSAPVDAFCGMPVKTKWHFPGFSDANSQLDINLTDFAGDGQFELSLDMGSSVFDAAGQDTYMAVFQSTLAALLLDPDSNVATFDLYSAQQKQALLDLGCGAPAATLTAPTLHEHFSAQVRRTPQALAVKQGSDSLTYAELETQANAIATYLHDQGIGPGDRVGLCCKRSIAMYAAMIGCMKVHAVFVPLDPTYPADRLSFMLSDSGAKLLISTASTDIEFDHADIPRITVEQAIDADSQDPLFSRDRKLADSTVSACTASEQVDRDALYIMYTSGSTGLPKGVVGTHTATLNRFYWMWRRHPFQIGEVCCQKTALSFVDSIWELFGPLLQGVPVVVIPDEQVLDIFQFVDVLDFEQISRLVVVPSFLSVLLDCDADITNRLRALEVCVVSGEPLPMHVALSFLNKLGHCQLLNLYGSTEVTADVTADTVTHDKLAVKMPIGRPIDGVDVYIVDDHLNLMPSGAVGEICVSGAGLSGGYFNQPELNAEKFIDHPFASGRLFKTGDLGRFNDNGLIEHHGRRDAQLKIRGHRIESAEIENTLLQFDGIRTAVLYAGENDQLIAFYVVTTGDSVDETRLLAYLEARLPEYMIPQLVQVAQIPLLGNGKINRKALALLLPQNQADSAATKPRTDTEAVLVEIWQNTLAIENVDIHADFFDLGGNSIAAMRIMVGARKAGFALSLKQILEIGTIAGIGIEIDNNPVQHLIESASHKATDLSIGQSADKDVFQTIEQQIAANPKIGGQDNVADMFHLTASQKGILFHTLLQGEGAPSYLAQIRCDLVGDMEADLFRQAWDVVVSRHDMLRSLIVHEGLQEPVQVIAKKGEAGVEMHDFRHLESEVISERCDDIARQKLHSPIALDRFPMFRATAIQTAAQTTHLILDWHHILMDGWSLAVMSNEVLLVYASLKNGQDHGLPEPGTFRDHVIALNQQDRNQVQSFWREKLAGFTATTPISDQSDSASELYAEANLNVLLDTTSSERLYEFARRCRVTPNTVIQAAWALLLAKYNDTDDVMFGFAVTGRSSGISNYENTVGMFVNSLPMRINCAGSVAVVDWLQQVQNEQMELVQYENSSLVDIQRASVLPANAPMFDSLMVFQNVPRLSVSNEFPLEIHNRKVHENSPTPITIEVFPGQQLEVQVMYIESLFREHPVAQVVDHFIHIIKSISANDANARVSDIGLMSDDEIRAMTAAFNQTERPYPDACDVSDLIWQQAMQSPHKTAATFGSVDITYANLTRRADELANYLRIRGVQPNDLVAVCLNRQENLLVALLAVMRAGAAYLPLDPDYPQHRIDTILENAAVVYTLTSSDVAVAIGGAPDAVLYLDSQWQQVADAPPVGGRSAVATVDDLAYVIYTSGSTGVPKGVRITRRNMVNFLFAMRDTPGMGSQDALLAVTTVSFDIAVLELFLPLICGARVDVASRDMAFDGFAMVERITQQGITMMQATPTTWRLMLAADWQGVPGFKALVGGEALPRDLAAALLPCVESLWNMYGPTETTVWSTCEHVTDASGTISIGRPIANTEVLILDGEQRLCPVNIPGELCIAGDGVTRGYVGRDELTAEKFIAHPLQPDASERVYRTGDLARWMDDGRLECLGRIDSQVKLRGFRIELGDIEARLSNVDGVDHAIVNLVRSADDEYLAAYLVADDGDEDRVPNELALRDYLRQYLPLYMIPSTYMFLDEVPRMPNGKVDRKSLPVPHTGTANAAELATVDVFDLPDNQPVTDSESQLSALWEKVLRRDRISVNSNFFDLGGNSISAMQIMSACKKKGLDVTILDMFNLGTIRRCAEAADARTDAQSVVSEIAARPVDKPSMAHDGEDLERIAQLLKSSG